MKTKVKRQRGGQLGNQNARKHGFYRASGHPARIAHSDGMSRRSSHQSTEGQNR